MRVATLLDPEGGRHCCNELCDGMFWAAGFVGPSPEYLADLLWRLWET